MFKSLRTNTNRMTNEEHGARNGVGIDHNRDLVASRPCFPLLSSSLLFLSIPSILNARTLSSAPFHAFGTPTACPSKPKASLGELGSRKLPENTLLPLPFGIFCILDQNIEQSFILCDNWC